MNINAKILVQEACREGRLELWLALKKYERLARKFARMLNESERGMVAQRKFMPAILSLRKRSNQTLRRCKFAVDAAHFLDAIELHPCGDPYDPEMDVCVLCGEHATYGAPGEGLCDKCWGEGEHRGAVS